MGLSNHLGFLMMNDDQVEASISTSGLGTDAAVGVEIARKDLTYCANNNRIVDASDVHADDLLGNSSTCRRSRIAMVNVITKIQVSLLIFLVVILAGVTGVHINDLRVPSVIRNGTEEFVILDCDYHIEEREKAGLVVKWFFNKQHSPVYQWIPNQRPQDLGILRGKLNLDYKADSDAYKMYRALKIIRPSIELTGEWICRVSTFYTEASKAASMIIFAPEREMGMKVLEARKPGFVNISCWAKGVFPEPKLQIYHGQNKDQTVDDMVFTTRLIKGAYDVSAYKVIEDSNFSSISSGSVFDCELSIPNTNYAARRSTLYEPGSMALKDGRSLGTSGSSTSEFLSSSLLFLSTLTTFLAVPHLIFASQLDWRTTSRQSL